MGVFIGGGGLGGGRSVANEGVNSEAAGCIVDYIDNFPIYELCTRVEQVQGYIRFLLWWDQDHIREEDGDSASKGTER